MSWCFAPASASRGDPCPDIPRELAIAQLTWHEAGVDGLADAEAIDAAISTTAAIRDRTWAEQACAYSGRALRGETRRGWISELAETLAAPASWPADLSWDVQGPLFERLLEHARQIVAGVLPRPCDREPTDWGGPEVDAARIRRGVERGFWYPVTCPGVREAYLRRTVADRGAD